MTQGASAGGVLDRIKAEGVVRCGASARPGFAAAEEGRITGLAVDLCRAVAIAVLGPRGRVEFRLYAVPSDWDAIRGGADDIAFVSGGEIAEGKLAGSLLTGPTAFIVAFALMAPSGAAISRVEDLAGQLVCFMTGSAAQRALEAAAAERGIALARLGFQEEAEMLDAYNAQRCRAVAGEAAELALMREDGGVNRLVSRILPEPLALDPVLAATGIGDGRWSALVAWVIDALILSDRPRSAWRADTLPLPAAALGLRERWREEIRAALGSYGDMARRDLGEDSPLKLPPGPNAPWPAGLLLPPGPG